MTHALVAGLAAAALLLFAIACWRGRWGVWVVGYLVAVAALAVALAAGRAPAPDDHGDAPLAWNLRAGGGFTSVSREGS